MRVDRRRRPSFVPRALACLALAGACSSEPDTPVDAFYRVKDAVEEGRAQDVLDGLTDRGRDRLAALCLLEAIEEQLRRPLTESLEELARRTGGDPIELRPHAMRGGVSVLTRHGIEEARLAELVERLKAGDSTGFGEVKAMLDDLPDRDAFLLEIVPLAELALFRRGSPREGEVDGGETTVRVRYLGEEGFAEGEVELVRSWSTWRIDGIDG